MSTLKVARFLIERSLRASSVVTTGELVSSIGPPGMQEALLKNWLVPDMDTGYLHINPNAGKLAEMRQACRCDSCQGYACACADQPAGQRRSSMPEGLREAWNGVGVGASSNIPARDPVMPQTQTPQSPTSSPQQNPKIGDDVMVADGGKNYTGKIGSVGQDGRYRLSFGNEKPPMDREYGPGEVRTINTATPSNAPGI